MLVAAMNPCPCGCYPDLERCRCTPGEIHRYLGKVSQPFLDRMDICIETPKISYGELTCEKQEESSGTIRERVLRARKIQKKRYREREMLTNSRMGRKEIEEFCCLEEKEKQMIERAFERLNLTARTYYKTLKVARTIADLEGSGQIRTNHLAEAISYRMVDQTIWGNQKR